MNPVVALVLTLTGCVLLIGFITLLAFRFVKVGRILKENGETLFTKNTASTNINKEEKVVVYVRNRDVSTEADTIESQKEDVIRAAKVKGYEVVSAEQTKTLEELKKEGVEIITLDS